jgi:hypothetical protein
MAESPAAPFQDDPQVQGYADGYYPNASGGPRLNKARFYRDVGASDTTVERWCEGCEYLDNERLVAIPLINPVTGRKEPTFVEADKRRIKIRKKGIREGRWRDKDGWWLSETRAGKLLKRGLKTNKPKRYSRLLRETPTSKRTLLRLAKLWEHKRAELDPEERCPEKLVRRAYNHNWYSEEALTLLKAWLTMPPGHYGTATDPRRDVFRAAKHVGCDKRTIQTLIADDKPKPVKDWSRNGRGEIDTIRLSDLDQLKAERDQYQGNGVFVNEDNTTEVTIKKAADETGLTPEQIRGMLPDLGTEAVRIRSLPTGGRPSYTIKSSKIKALEKDISRELLFGIPTGRESIPVLARRFGGEDPESQNEFRECVKCWDALGKLTIKPFLVEQETKSRWGGTCKRIVEVRTCRVASAQRLWENTCSVEAGAKLLKRILKDGPRPIKDVKNGAQVIELGVQSVMRKNGFIGRRLYRALDAAGVQARPEGNAAKPWVYELTGNGAPQDLVEILQRILAQGPLLTKVYEQQVSRAGLSRRRGAVERAEKESGIASHRIGWNGPWYTHLSNQVLPTPEELARKDTIPPSNQEVAGGAGSAALPTETPKHTRRYSRPGRPLVASVSERDQKIIDEYFAGKGNPSELARAHGVKRSYASLIINRAKRESAANSKKRN